MEKGKPWCTFFSAGFPLDARLMVSTLGYWITDSFVLKPTGFQIKPNVHFAKICMVKVVVHIDPAYKQTRVANLEFLFIFP